MKLIRLFRSGLIVGVLLSTAWMPWFAMDDVSAKTEVDKVAIVTPASRSNQGWDQQGVDTLVAIGKDRDIEVEVVENAGNDPITPVFATWRTTMSILCFATHRAISRNVLSLRNPKVCRWW